MNNETPREFDETERLGLEKRLRQDLWILGGTVVATLALTAYFLQASAKFPPLLAVVTAGTLGSALGALVSCLNRQAMGFEDSKGGQSPAPEKDKKSPERFNVRMSRWFRMRPLLGTVMSAVVYWGISGEIFCGLSAPGNPESALPQLVFYGFVAGLFAKSIIDILRELPKNVFKQ